MFIFSFQSLVDSRDVEGKTAIHQCSIFGSSDCARVILVNGAQVDALKRGDWSPLMHSVARADLQLVALLLENGADIRICNKDGWNAIALATRTGNQHLLDMLEKHSLLKHFHSAWHIRTKNGRTLLHIAAMNGHIHFANRFLADSFFAKPLDVNATDVCGVTPFMDAARIDSLEMCQLFKHYSGNSFNVNQVDASGRSALHMAAQANAISVVKYLVSELQCEKNLEDVWHQTALFLAVREGHLEMTELLLQLGAKRTSDGHKRNLFDIAKQYNHQHLLPYFS